MLPKRKSKFFIGDLLKHKISGFQGVVSVVAYYSTGCLHYGLQEESLSKDGEPKDWQWFDESYLELVESSHVESQYSGVIIQPREFKGKVPDKPTSGPFPNPPQA